MVVIEGNQPTDATLGMDPAQGMGKDVELPRVITDDRHLYRKPMANKLPINAPSVARVTWRGLLIPTSARCCSQAAWSAKRPPWLSNTVSWALGKPRCCIYSRAPALLT